jgi:lysophospholipase L1-like esterase
MFKGIGIYFLFLLIVIGIIGCGGGGGGESNNSPTSPTDINNIDFGDNNPNLYVAFGDSITRGYGSGDSLGKECPTITGEGYPPKLERMINSTVLNEGVCGEMTSQGVERIRRVLSLEKPGFILIMEGSNDADVKRSAAIVKSNLRSMIESAKSNKTIPIIATLPPMCCSRKYYNKFINLINDQIRQLSIEEGIALADVSSDMKNDPRFIEDPHNLLSRDGLHPNDLGYEVIAKSFYNAIFTAKTLARAKTTN